MRTSLARWGLATVAAVACAGEAHAAAYDEAIRLRDEGRRVLEGARSGSGDEIKGSKEAVKIWERATALLGGFGEGTREAELLQDLNSLIFWTRRTTPMDLSALRSSSNAPPVRPAKTNVSAAEAVAALSRTEAYARAHPDDPMTVAARFFEVADTYKSVHDVAFKAISRAQYFQRQADEREALRKAEAAYATLSADARLVVDGDRAYAKGDYDGAIAAYAKAAAAAPTPERHRKLGHARFNRAQQYREEYSKEYIELYKQYKEAQRRKNKARMAQLARKSHEIKSISAKAKDLYTKADASFNSAWVASDHFDIDAEVHMALCRTVRMEPYHQKRAKETLKRVLRVYFGKLKNDEERTLSALAETYAGPEVAARIAEQLKAAAASAEYARGEGEIPGMSDEELTAEIRTLSAEVEAGEKKLQRKRAVGVLDGNLHRKVTTQKKRLENLKAEAAKRGL